MTINYGYGQSATGGAGGTSYVVTNLNDSGAGSLREAIDASGARIITFSVGGLITVETKLIIAEGNGDITIDGSTAPYPGITIRNGLFEKTTILNVQASNVIISHIRIRGQVPDASIQPVKSHRALVINNGAQNVMLKNYTGSWGIDTCNAISSPRETDHTRDITVQDCIAGPPLDNSVHDEGRHGMAFDISNSVNQGPPPAALIGSYNITFFRTLLLMAWRRMPQVTANGPIDISNNVIYHWAQTGIRMTDKSTKLPIIIEGNYFKPGSETNPSDAEVTGLDQSAWGYECFLADNESEHNTLPPQTNLFNAGDKALDFIVAQKPFTTPYTLPLTSASDAYTYVLANAGATLPRRDTLDRWAIDHVTNGTGNLIDAPTDTPGWEWWGYLVVENLALTNGQRDNIWSNVDGVQTYSANEPNPALQTHAITSGGQRIFEGIWNEYNIDADAFRAWVATELSVDVSTVTADEVPTSFGDVVHIRESNTHHLRIIYAGGLHSTHVNSRSNLGDYLDFSAGDWLVSKENISVSESVTVSIV